ncbi:hypothetical protein DYBT9275_04696 [Dyadobacter sp. CECT 9275]|uniref:Uncharacterized protein n=1 Tax=Dyadobacter helix TaxID=2822344 RepID=A0A916JFM3_9BACT|nr:hypothetical protein [Dyadobacter sp. CECT 9275]CAG5010339.1 hypothetical protein DYBT9275_04696 [Dyadobacter sp. CECT 9275]
MKTVLSSLLLLILCSQLLFAQDVRKPDVILLRDNTKLEVIIQEVDDQKIKYKKLSNPDGPVFTIKKSDITSIMYSNGETEIMEATIEVPNYYSPSAQTPHKNERYEARAPRNQFEQEIQTADAERLRMMFTHYKSKSRQGLTLAIGGMSAGIIAMGIGVGIIANAVDSQGYYKSQQDEQRAKTGAYLVLGGFAGAATFGTIGFVRAGKNNSKAGKAKRELTRRNEPLKVSFSPGFDLQHKAGYIGLSMSF